MDIPWAKRVEEKARIGDQHTCKAWHADADIWVMNFLEENNIYPIARIAVFADDIFARAWPLEASESGGLGKGAAEERPPTRGRVGTQRGRAGGDEEGLQGDQWDYVRFPTDGKLGNLRFPAKTDTPPNEVIAQCWPTRASWAYGAIVSADIFGLTGLVSTTWALGSSSAPDYERGLHLPDGLPVALSQGRVWDSQSRCRAL